MKNRIRLVLYLLILSNVFDLFITRGASVGYYSEGGSRFIIQIFNVLALFLSVAIVKINVTRDFEQIWLFVVTIFVYLFIYIVGFDYRPNVLANTIRLLLNLYIFLVSYLGFLLNAFRRTDIILFIISILLSVSKKLFESHDILLEFGQGGDYVSISLVFLVPFFFLYLKRRTAMFLTVISFILILFSLRRSCIIAFIVCSPFLVKFLWKSISHRIIIVLGFFVLCVTVIFFWIEYGEEISILLTSRFSDMFTEDKNGNYGSSRSAFYYVLWRDYIQDPIFYLWGHGIGSVASFYSNTKMDIDHAHNDFLEIIYTFGLWGLILWCSFLHKVYSICRERVVPNISNMNYLLKYLFFSYLIIALSSGTIMRSNFIPFMILCAFFSVNKKKLAYENPNI